ncbi:MAG: hypothetical protein RR360_05660 [Raoultibacter sp.]
MAQKRPKRKSLIVRTEDGNPVMEVFGMKTVGDKMIMDGKALDSMTMDVIVSIDDVAKGYEIVDKRAVWAFIKQFPAARRRLKKLNKEQSKTN